jgi:4-amino-4-deoxy-L-arabinose transferase-like glycosyltransferase
LSDTLKTRPPVQLPATPSRPVTQGWLFAALTIGIYGFLLVVAWATPATFFMEVPRDGSDTDLQYLNRAYFSEQLPDGARFRWLNTGATLQIPPVSSADKITLRVLKLPAPTQPDGDLVLFVNGQEAARLPLKPDWNEYSFNLIKRFAVPGYYELRLDAPAFQPPNDPRLLMLGFQWVKVETTGGLNIPPLGLFFALWAAGAAFMVGGFWQIRRGRLSAAFFLLMPLALLGMVVQLRPEVARSWFLILVAGVGIAAISYVLRVKRPDKTVLWLGLILAIAALARLYRLGDIPLGILPDEAVLGYDAYSVLKTGRDHHGDWLPLYFRAFNDYPPGIAHYIALPSLAIFGLNLAALRLPFALLGIGTVLFTFLLCLEFFRALGQKAANSIGLMAALLVAVSPWAISQSRVALQVSTLSFFLVGGLWAFLAAVRRRQEGLSAWRYWLPAGVLLGVSVWSYFTMRLLMALIVAGLLIFFAPFFRRHLRSLLGFVLPFTAVCLPFTVLTLLFWSTYNYRFSLISVWANNDFWGGLGQFVVNYLSHFDPLRLFFGLNGDYTVTMSSRPILIGVVLPILLIPAVAGLFATFTPQLRRQKPIWVLWLWLFVFPLGDALTREDVPDEIRAMSGVALFEILAALGVWWLWQKLAERAPGWRDVATVAAGGLFVLVTAYYLHYAFVLEPVQRRDYFRYGFQEALAQAQKNMPADGKICIETSSQAYILVLFHSAYDPTAYQRFARENDPTTGTSYVIPAFDRYKFNCDVANDLGEKDVGIARTPRGKFVYLWQSYYPNNTRDYAVVRRG